MGSLLAKLVGRGKKLELCLVGLENSGKTTLLNLLSCGQPLEPLPTIGLNIKMVKKEGVAMKVWDLGGQERFRNEWVRYTTGCDAIVFVVDSSDYDRMEMARKELFKLLEDSSLESMPLLIALNKIDLSPRMSKEEVIKELKLNEIPDNPWMLHEISAKEGKNINEVIKWLTAKAH